MESRLPAPSQRASSGEFAFAATVLLAAMVLTGQSVGSSLDPSAGPLATLAEFCASTALLTVVLALLLFPAAVLGRVFGRQFGTASNLRIAAIAAGVWTGWGALVAVAGSAISRLVLLPGPFVEVLLLAGLGGGTWSYLAFRRATPAAPGFRTWALFAAALLVLLAVAILMSGRWGVAV